MKLPALPCGILACVLALASARAQSTVSSIPHLEKRDGMTKLIVEGRPFICVAGELANTTSSDREATKAAIARLAAANLNTILTVVSWDLVEPEEGKFDFSMIDYQIEAAHAAHVRLIFLWMASWKNGLSHFPPAWVKANQDRFPRVVNGEGKSLEILSTLSQANRDADAKAFAAVLKHIREVDKNQTVIGFQVENEVGIMGSTRDFCDAANAAFAGPVPKALTDYLQKNRNNLLPELKKIWDAAGNKTSGTWEEVFGKNVPRPANDKPVPNSPGRQPRAADAELFNHTDEIFMAWNYASYIGYVAAQGKKAYPLPMYVNTWLVQPNDLGPGDYPSGGPEPLVHDIWRAAAPAIDILAPDIYLPQYAQIIQTYARNGNPAFNPETEQNANTCWNAFTELNLLCFSPFGIDELSPDSPFARSYGFISSVSGAIAEAQGRQDAIKLIKLGPARTLEKSKWADTSLISPPLAANALAVAKPLPMRRPRRPRQPQRAAVAGAARCRCLSSTPPSCSSSTPRRTSITLPPTARSRSASRPTTSPVQTSLPPPPLIAGRSRMACGSPSAGSTAMTSCGAVTTSPPPPPTTRTAP